VAAAPKEAVWACPPEDGLVGGETSVKVRRLPVIDEPERFVGLPPLADLLQHSSGGSKHPLPMHQVGETSTAACAPGTPRSRPPLPDKAPSPRSTPTVREGARREGRGGRPLNTARRKHPLSPLTIAVRWCSGCRRLLGVKLWSQTGHVLVHTHGLCDTCFGRMTDDEFMDPNARYTQTAEIAAFERKPQRRS
jgi:hypothetical protein